KNIGWVFTKRFQCATKLTKLRYILLRGPSPPVPQKAVMKIIGHIGIHIRGQPGHVVPGNLWATRQRGWHAQLISLEKSANINLAVRCTSQTVVAIASHKAPLVAKVVIDSEHADVIVLRNAEVRFKALNIHPITTAKGAPGIIGQGLILRPHLL